MADVARAIGYLQTTSFPDNTTGAITPQNERDFVVTIKQRTPRFRATDPEYGAVGTGTSTPLSSVYSSATTPALLAAVTVGGATPYSWATNAAYGLTFTKTTSASTASGNAVLHFAGLSGDLANPMKFLVVGMTVTGTNIPAGTTISSISFTSGTPNKIDGPLAGTATMSATATGTVASGATITFSYSSTMMGALQMDWLGIQAAEYAGGQVASGGQTYIPGGTYLMSRPILRSDTPVGSSFAHQTSFVGDGPVSTVLNWSTDLGPGVWAVTPPNRTNSGTLAQSDIRDMALMGPGNGTTMGTAGCNMQGLAMGGGGNVAMRVRAQGWWAGCNIVGDHQQCISCIFQNNYYNLYFGPLNNQNNGDQSFIDCWLDGPTFSSVACSGTNQITYALFLRCHLGFGPYGFYKESGATTNFLIACLLMRVSMESCGNGSFYDENAAGLIAGSRFICCDMNLDTTNAYEISSRTTYGAIYCGNMDSCEFDGEADPYTNGYNRSTRPYTTAIIVVQQGLTNTYFKSAGTLVTVGTTTFPAVSSGNALDGTTRFDGGNVWGTFRTIGGAITASTFVSNTDYGVVITPTATHPGIVGLALYAASGSIGTAAVPVATGGVATVAKNVSTDVIAGGIWLQIASSTNGKIIAFNSASRTCTVGRVWLATTSGQTTLSMEVDIKGP